MNLDELQSVQSRERQTDSLQQLRESFYEDAGRFISQLREERERAAEAAEDPFDAPEVRRLSDDIKTAERTVEAIYERRIGKLVKQASLEAAGMAADASGLTAEEMDAFERLVDTIETNRAYVLDEVVSGDPTETADRAADQVEGEQNPAGEEGSPVDSIEGDPSRKAGRPPETPTGSEESSESGGSESPGGRPGGARGDPADDAPRGPEASEETTREPPTEERVSAADVMGGDPSAGAGTEPAGETGADVDGGSTDGREATAGGATDDVRSGSADRGDAARSTGETGDAPGADPGGVGRGPSGDTGVERTTVRITQNVGEILGVDERSYDLATEDVVTLPRANAEPLLQRDAAERLE